MTLKPLARLRRQLTAWYLATLCLMLLLLGGGLFVTISGQIERQLDESLRSATSELIRAARIREMEAASAKGTVVDAIDELHIPERSLYLLSATGQAIKPGHADAWIEAAARAAAGSGSVDRSMELPDQRTLRLHAERFLLSGGQPMVAVAVADRVELEEEYAALLAAFGGAAFVALLMVAVGVFVLVRKSTAPIERSIDHMRRFMADAAHELRTPITVLRSRAEVALQQAREPAAYVEALRGIESESKRLGGIVDNLLTLARADSGEQRIGREQLYLDDLVDDAASAARVLAEPRSVSVEVIRFEEAVIEADPTLIRQMLMILLDNAVKFTEPGGRVRVEVATSGGRPCVSVEDTGVGIEAELLPHVFERFYRGDRARAHSGGAGLGLSIARWIADAHGADIELSSQPGRGTRVVVRFTSAAKLAV